MELENTITRTQTTPEVPEEPPVEEPKKVVFVTNAYTKEALNAASKLIHWLGMEVHPACGLIEKSEMACDGPASQTLSAENRKARLNGIMESDHVVVWANRSGVNRTVTEAEQATANYLGIGVSDRDCLLMEVSIEIMNDDSIPGFDWGEDPDETVE